MVCDWGMSTLGPVAYGENQDTIFLGREISRTENYSEETSRRIDAEIHRIILEQYERAKEIIIERRAALNKIAEALLEYETIEGRHILEILQFGEIRSSVTPVPLNVIAEKAPDKKAPDRAPLPTPCFREDLPLRIPHDVETGPPLRNQDLLHRRRLRRRPDHGDDRPEGSGHPGEGGGHERRAHRRVELRCPADL
jgi:hypothetical protein